MDDGRSKAEQTVDQAAKAGSSLESYYQCGIIN